MDGVTIIDSSSWADVQTMILMALNFLDSIVLFDVREVHLTFLGFDIAVLVFGIVWNTVGLWKYDFDEVYYDPWADSADDLPDDSLPPFTGYQHFNEDGEDYSKIDILPGDDDDDAL